MTVVRLVVCGKRKYSVQLFSERDVLIRRFDVRPWRMSIKIGTVRSFDEALRFIRADAGSDKFEVRECASASPPSGQRGDGWEAWRYGIPLRVR